MTKSEQLRQWLEANPGKTDRDWLLEERCPDDSQREQFKEFLQFCDDNNIKLLIPSLEYDVEGNVVQFDFMIFNFGSYYDLDTPDSLYTGKWGYNEQGWFPFLIWKWNQVLIDNVLQPEGTEIKLHKKDEGWYEVGYFPKDLEDISTFFIQDYSRKWNHPETMKALKEFFDDYSKVTSHDD